MGHWKSLEIQNNHKFRTGVSDQFEFIKVGKSEQELGE